MVNRTGEAGRTTAQRQRRATARKRVCDLGQGVVLELTTDRLGRRGTAAMPHADWYYDLRRGRLCFYGGVLRVIDQCVDSGKPIEFTRTITEWLNSYIADQYTR